MRGWLPNKVCGPHLLSLLFLNICLGVVAILNFRVLNYMGMYYLVFISGADPEFQVRGGGGALKKIAASRGRRENFGGISCEKSRFYAKKILFFQF